MRFIAIDPGSTGALAYFENNKVIGISSIPITILSQGSTRKIPDVDALRELLDSFNPDCVVIERVNAGPADGNASAGTFMLNVGAVVGCAARYPRVFVLPVRWKAYAGLIGKPKAASVKKAHERHPETIPMIVKQKNAIDRADAVLMGSYYIDMILKEGRR